MGVTALAMGIPAGVKIHSAVFGVNPASTGELAAQFLRDEIHTLRNEEVMDIDEVAYR
jgi:predicted polyphosphate/ATP-dependent NAD kinase